MGRSNTPTSLEKWRNEAESLPYRASIGADCIWDVGRPPPYLIGASKVCRGGRMILAFDLAEVRDYFVEGHADQGAQAEPDHSDEPRPRATRRTNVVGFVDYEEARETMIEALAGYEAARGLMSEAFLTDIQELISADRMDDAVALTSSMPTDCVEKAVAWSYIAASSKRDMTAAGGCG